jgi:hypothetical protein
MAPFYWVSLIDDQISVQSGYTASSVPKNQKIGVSGQKISPTLRKDD